MISTIMVDKNPSHKILNHIFSVVLVGNVLLNRYVKQGISINNPTKPPMYRNPSSSSENQANIPPRIDDIKILQTKVFRQLNLPANLSKVKVITSMQIDGNMANALTFLTVVFYFLSLHQCSY